MSYHYYNFNDVDIEITDKDLNIYKTYTFEHKNYNGIKLNTRKHMLYIKNGKLKFISKQFLEDING